MIWFYFVRDTIYNSLIYMFLEEKENFKAMFYKW